MYLHQNKESYGVYIHNTKNLAECTYTTQRILRRVYTQQKGTKNLTECIYATQRILRSVYTQQKEAYGVYIDNTKNLTECIYTTERILGRV